MRKFPRASWMKQSECFDSVGASLIFLILCMICPPLVIIFCLIYDKYKANEDSIKSGLSYIITIIIVLLLFVGSPIIVIGNIIQGTFISEFVNLIPVLFFFLLEIVFAFWILTDNFSPKSHKRLKNFFCQHKIGITWFIYFICVIGIITSIFYLSNCDENDSDTFRSMFFLLCVCSIPILYGLTKWLNKYANKNDSLNKSSQVNYSKLEEHYGKQGADYTIRYHAQLDEHIKTGSYTNNRIDNNSRKT